MYETILYIIAGHDGEHTWYTLDRALAGRFDVSLLLMPALKQLAQDGMIEPRGAAPMPTYWVTEKGKAHVAETLHAAMA
jgi:DNA-binding PadR family transcriptional regulator